MNGFLKFHLILQEFLYLFETVTDNNFKLLFLDVQYLSLSGMLFGPAVLWWSHFWTVINRARVLRSGLSDFERGLDVDLVIDWKISQNLVLLFEFSQYLVLSVFHLIESPRIWWYDPGLNSFCYTLCIVDITETTGRILHKVVLLGFLKASLIQIVLQERIVRIGIR